jgi:CheY-like chemotaxis protein
MRRRAEDKGLAFQVEGDVRAAAIWATARGSARWSATCCRTPSSSRRTGGVTLRIAANRRRRRGARLILEIEDTGIGFDADHAAGLFGRFHQADASISRRFGGTGLGLSICRSLVEMMGGEISAVLDARRRQPLRRLAAPAPRRARRGLSRPTAQAASRRRRRPPLRVLLVEDHPTNQRVAQLILATQGAEVTTVDDGLEALDAFKAGTFDVVLMDMQMPRMDGWPRPAPSAPWKPRRGAARTPIIMLSANALTAHREQTLAAGADLHVSKPITAADLLAGIQAAVASL